MLMLRSTQRHENKIIFVAFVSFAWIASTARMTLRGSRERRRRLTPDRDAFAPRFRLRNEWKKCRGSVEKRGRNCTFCSLGRRGNIFELIPRLMPGARGVDFDPSEKKDLFFTEGFVKPRGGIHPLHRGVEIDIRIRCGRTRTWWARSIVYVVFCVTSLINRIIIINYVCFMISRRDNFAFWTLRV